MKRPPPSLPHTLIKDCLFLLLKICFQNGQKPYIKVTDFKTSYVANLAVRCYTQQDIEELITIILNQTYVKFASLVFKQVLGVPMGGNASAQIADLTLAVLEYKHLKNMRNTNFFLCRYIDDLLVLNYPDFNNFARAVYPNELDLKKTNTYDNTVNFLDICINITGNGLKITLYDKTDDFNFRVIKYGFADSNVH